MAEHTFAVCAYKESPYLERCLDSLRAQTIKSNIIIVTSTPNDYIEKMAARYQIPYYINHGEKGITQDWNFAYAKAKTKTKYITIAHQDDVYDAGYLEEALKRLGRAKKPLIFFCDYYEIRDGRRVTKNKLLGIKRLMLLPLRLELLQGSRWVRRRILSLGSPICCPSVTFAAEYLPEAVFAHHYRVCEDWEAWEKLSKLKGEFVYSPQALMGHRIHADSETSAAIDDHTRTREEYEMFCKFWPVPVAKMISGIYASGQKSNQL
ncbi:MAG: glycosyltransferase [Eubacteriales bacterium]|nr:glycosyltransferase [Eubacteriales bacterium]